MPLVILTWWNEAPLAIQCSPVAGESGWICNGFGTSGSALPAMAQSELWNFHLFGLLSGGTMSLINLLY